MMAAHMSKLANRISVRMKSVISARRRRPFWHPVSVLATLAVLGALVVGCAGGGVGREGHVDISQADLQARLAAKFPLKSCANVLACITVSDPVLTLYEDTDRIGLAARITPMLVGFEAQARLALSGKVRYDASRGELFLDELLIDRLEAPGLSPQWVEALQQKGPGVLRLALQNSPLYTLREWTGQEGLIKSALRDVRVVNGKLRISFVRPGL